MNISHAAAAFAAPLMVASVAQAQSPTSRYGGHFVTSPGPRGVARWVPDSRGTDRPRATAISQQPRLADAKLYRDARSDARYGGHFVVGAGARSIARWVPAAPEIALPQRFPASDSRPQQSLDHSARIAAAAKPAATGGNCDCSMMSGASMDAMGKPASEMLCDPKTIRERSKAG